MARGRSRGRYYTNFGSRSHDSVQLSGEDDFEAMLQGRSPLELLNEYVNEKMSKDDLCRSYSRIYGRLATSDGKDCDCAVDYRKKLLASCPERYLHILSDDYVFPKRHDKLKIPEGRTALDLLDEHLEKTLSNDDWCRLFTRMYKRGSRMFGKDSDIAVDYKEKLVASCPERYLKILSDSDGLKHPK